MPRRVAKTTARATSRVTRATTIPEEKRLWLISGVDGPELAELQRNVAVSADDLKRNWNDVMGKITHILDQTPAGPAGFGLNLVEISLTLEHSGKIGFIFAEGSAKVAATFKVQFTRR